MKKIICCLFVLVGVAICFAGCNDLLSGEYWVETSNQLTEYFESEENIAVMDMSYTENIKTISEQGGGRAYLELYTLYNPLFESSIFSARNYSTVFKTRPASDSKINDQFNRSIQKVNGSLENYKKAVGKFLLAKQSYGEHVNYSDIPTATSEIEQARLLKFKRDYLELITASLELSENIYSARVIGYNDIADFSPEDNLTDIEIAANRRLAINVTNLKLARANLEILKAYNAKDSAYMYNNFNKTCVDFFENVVTKFYNSELEPAIPENSLDKLISWKAVFSQYEKDSKFFDETLKALKLDLLTKNNNDPVAYSKATKNPEDEAKASFFLTFYKEVRVLHDYTIVLIGE